MNGDSILITPGDIAMLGDDFRAHLKHFSAGERLAIAVYVMSIAAAEIPAEDRPAALTLAAQAMAARLISDAAA